MSQTQLLVGHGSGGQSGSAGWKRSKPCFSMEKYPVYTKWMVLCCFMWNTFWNGFMFMDFSGDAALAKEIFGIGDPGLNLLYSASLISVVPVYIPTIIALDKCNRPTIGTGVVCNVIGAWLRLLAWETASYPLAVLSSVMIGLQCACIVTSFVQMVERWFPPNKRALATQMAIQANYAGWAAGTMAIPQFGGDKESLQQLFLWQAVMTSMGFVLFTLFWQAPPKRFDAHEHGRLSRPSLLQSHRERVSAQVDSGGKPWPHHCNEQGQEQQQQQQQQPVAVVEGEKQSLTGADGLSCNTSSVNGDRGQNTVSQAEPPSTASEQRLPRESLAATAIPEASGMAQAKLLFGNRQFMLQCFCHSTLGGLSFTIPAVQGQGFKSMGFSNPTSGWASFVFIMSGVVLGIGFGFWLNTIKRAGAALRPLYLIVALSLTACLFIQRYKDDLALGHNQSIMVFILLMIPAGGASLGFLGPAMGVAVAGTHPVSELYSSGAIELGIQVMGAVLTQLSSGSAGYTVLSVASWIIALIMIFGFAPPDDPDSDEVHSTHHQGARYEEVGMESGTASA